MFKSSYLNILCLEFRILFLKRNVKIATFKIYYIFIFNFIVFCITEI